jgi:hypothetical protein
MGRTGGGVFNTAGKSGSNVWHGSALMQNRPEWGAGKFFFAQNLPKPDTYFWLYGGSFGGPIVRDQTFFWATTESYRTKTSRSAVLLLPTDLERRGDFSQSNVTIYDPLTTTCDAAGTCSRQPFLNNRIPEGRINPVARAVMEYLPSPTSGNSRPAVAELKDRANQATVKIDHRSRGSTAGSLARIRGIPGRVCCCAPFMLRRRTPSGCRARRASGISGTASRSSSTTTCRMRSIRRL